MSTEKAGAGSWDTTSTSWRYRVKNPGDFQPTSFRTKVITTNPHPVTAVMGRPKGKTTMEIQSLIFSKDDWDSLDEAKAWVSEHFKKDYELEEQDRKSFTAQAEASDEGIVEAIVSVFNNTDRQNEVIRPGFFKNSLGKKLPKGVWSHDWRQPVAKTLEARELEAGDPQLPTPIAHLGGLYIKGQFNLDTQAGRETYSNIKFGIVDEFSIGYRTIKSAFNEDTDVVELLEGELFEWSPVLVGANPATQLLSVKSGEPGPQPSYETTLYLRSLLVKLWQSELKGVM